MKIAFVVPFFEAGGVEMFILRLGGFFQRQGHKVIIVVTEKCGAWFDVIEKHGFETKKILLQNSFNSFIHMIKVGRFLSREKYDAIFLNHARYAQAVLSMLSKDVIAIPIIHNDNKDIYRIALANSKAWNVAIGVCSKVRDVAQDMVPYKKVIKIYYGVDLPMNEMLQKRKEFKLPLKLLFVGRLDNLQKGIFYLPDIVKECMKRGLQVKLTIVGDGCDLEQLLQKIRDQQLEDVILLKGVLQNDAIYKELLDHHVLLVPSYYEGFCIVILEAQACGCIPIASKLEGGTTEGIQEGRTGFLVKVSDVIGFVDYIEKIYKNPKLWFLMSHNGALRIAKDFSIERMGNDYLNLIEGIKEEEYQSLCRGKKWFGVDFAMLTKKDFNPSFLMKHVD